jgi:DNA-binding transcriptional LysR family regulator
METMLDTLPSFLAVAETASFTKGAQRLHVSTAAISKAIGKLERELGTAVFHRTTRAVSLTEAGQTLFESAQRIVAERDLIEDRIRGARETPNGNLSVTFPVSLGAHGRGRYSLTRASIAFAQKYPDISMTTTLSDAKLDIVREHIDVAVRVAPLEDTSLKVRIISPCPFVLVASPAYLTRAGTPVRAGDLKAHGWLAYQNHVQPGAIRYQGTGLKTEALNIPCRFATNNGDQLITAALAGLGIALLPRLFIEDDIRTGRLVHIMQDIRSLPERYLALYYPDNGPPPAKTRAFIDFMVEWFAACNDQARAK